MHPELGFCCLLLFSAVCADDDGWKTTSQQPSLTPKPTSTTAIPCITVPPKAFWASVNNSTSVTLFWSHVDHKCGPTTFYITVGEAANLTSDSFENKIAISVNGFNNTSVLIEGLRSYWKYTFNITKSTPDGNLSLLFVNGTVRTKESAPGKVEHLHIEQIPGHFTSVNISFSCPKETERHGDIKYYTLSYEAQVDDHNNVTENRKGLNISAESQSNCNYSQVVSVTPQTNYTFSVVAHDSLPGKKTSKNHFAAVGTPGNVSDYMSTFTTSTSIGLSWKPPIYPNGYILGYVLYVDTEEGECQQVVHIVCTDCQSHGTFRDEDEKCPVSRNISVQKLETSRITYNATALLSYTNYTFTVAAVNNFSIGIKWPLAVQTDIDVPSQPGNLSTRVLNASAVEITWTPPSHKSGPTDYTIIQQQTDGRFSSTYDNTRNVTVNGYESSKTTINGLLSSWRYRFSITASTCKGDSFPTSGSSVITQESEPDEVENLEVSSIPSNLTAVELTWDCPKETERNGFIRNYTIKYSDRESVSMIYGHYEPEDPCNETHTAILTVRPEHDYTFTVVANAMYRGKPKQSEVFHAIAGKSGPVASLDVLNTTANSIMIQWTRPSRPNGIILGYLIKVTSVDKPNLFINITCEQPEQQQQECNVIDTSDTKKTVVVNGDGNGQYNYNITNLLSYTNYTIVLSCFNIKGTGMENNTIVQTNITVPVAPKKLWALVNSSSSMTLLWIPAKHQDGPTTYYIRVMEEIHLRTETFEVKEIISVRGFDNTSVLIEGLRSYWKYKFNITAATSCGNSSALSTKASFRPQESAPGDVEHIHLHHFQDNYTCVEVTFSCPNETERHGIINYYILSYEAQVEHRTEVTENPQGLNISAQNDSDCNYSLMVPVTAQVNYTFSVQAFNKYEGKISTKNYTTLTGDSGPVDSFDVLNTTANSIMIQWTKPLIPNDIILGYLINVTSDDNPHLVINVTCEHPEHKNDCEAVNTSNTKTSDAVWKRDGHYGFNITALQSYTYYTVVISCVNINGTGKKTNITVQTNMTVPTPPKEFWASASSSSNVTLFWTPADHQDGPIIYYITVGEAADLTKGSFEKKMAVSVSGFYNTSVLIEGLRSYWKYTFNITASTPVGNSSVLSVNGTVRTKESAPGEIQNLVINPIPNNFTSVEVFFSCPEERERHGDIKYYILSYEAQEDDHNNVTENRKGLNISAESQSNCNYSQVVSVNPQTNYEFSVVAHDSYNGSASTRYYFTNPEAPGNVSKFTSTSTTSTSVSLSWTPPRNPNGYILGYVLYVHTEDKECQQAVHIVCTDCQSHGTFRVVDEKCRLSTLFNDTEPKLNASPANYNFTALLSYTNYTFTVAAVNNFSIGINTSEAVQTYIDVPSQPGNLSTCVLSASAVEITWTPPSHKSGPTDYTIILQKATGRLSSTFENTRNVTVHGYKSSKTTINGLLSSWRYTFSITASTFKGGSLPTSGSNIITQESEPHEVQNLRVFSIPGNFTAVNLTWDCPKERERNGFIRNYTIQYSDPGAISLVHGHYEPEDPCDKTHTAILPVRPEHEYTFTVSANAMYKGKPKQSKVFHASAGKAPIKDSTDIFISITSQRADASTETSFVVSFDSTTLLDGTNGNIIKAGILVMKENERPPKDPENVKDWDTWKNWYKWKNSGYKGSYRPTPEHYLIPARRRRGASSGETLTYYLVGVDENCDSKKDQFCNGPLEPETAYMVVAVSCTTAGCSSTEPFGNFKTKISTSSHADVTPWIAFGVTTAVLLCIITILVIYFKVVQPARTQRSRGEGPALELSTRGTDGTEQREDIPYDEVPCGSSDQNTSANRYYENVDTKNQHTYETLANPVNEHDMHLYDAVQMRL